MDLKSKLGVADLKLALFAVFYLITGILNFAALIAYGFNLSHLALLGFLSITTAYLLFASNKWALWLVIAMFPIILTDAFFLLQYSITYYTFSPDIATALFHIALIIYPLLAFVALVYTAAKRSILK